MNDVFNSLKQDHVITVSLALTLFLLCLNLFIIILVYTKLPPYLPLFNQMPWGEQRLGNRSEIFIPAVITAIVSACNATLSFFLYSKIPLVSRILCATALLMAFFSLFFVVRTIYLVT